MLLQLIKVKSRTLMIEIDTGSNLNSPETVSSACVQRHVKNPPQRPRVGYGPNSAGCQYRDPVTFTGTNMLRS